MSVLSRNTHGNREIHEAGLPQATALVVGGVEVHYDNGKNVAMAADEHGSRTAAQISVVVKNRS